jgi:hypothetical protein
MTTNKPKLPSTFFKIICAVMPPLTLGLLGFLGVRVWGALMAVEKIAAIESKTEACHEKINKIDTRVIPLEVILPRVETALNRVFEKLDQLEKAKRNHK